MTYRNRDILTLILILTALLVGGSAMAEDETPTPSGVRVHGNVYGGGKLADVKVNTEVNICVKYDTSTEKWVSVPLVNGVTIEGNVYGGGKGTGDNSFTCDKAMVGVDGEGLTDNTGGTTVRIGNGTVGKLVETTNEDTNETVTTLTGGNVYGGGEVGRVEKNTVVIIGIEGDDNSKPVINGDVFGAGEGLPTHGYSALVRGNSSVTVQGGAEVKKSVYGGGEIATVGRYIVVDGYPTEPNGGGICTVIIKDKADISGNVVGGGKGVTPSNYNSSQHMIPSGTSGTLVGFNSQAAYFTFLETLALASETQVTIGGTIAGKTAVVRGNVYGGSESGFLQRHTQVTVLDNCEIGTASAGGNIYGGGKGLSAFADAGRVSGYTKVFIKGGIMHGSVYGGGELGYTKGGANVNMTGGTVGTTENGTPKAGTGDVYGGGALADTNIGNGNEYIAVPGIITGASVADLYEKKYKQTGDTEAKNSKTYYELKAGLYVVKNGLTVGQSIADLYEIDFKQTSDETAALGKTYYEYDTDREIYVVKNGLTAGQSITNLYEIDYDVTSDGSAIAGKSYYTLTHPTTVNLLGGTILRDAYGGGLGSSAVAALVFGDTKVNLNGMAISEYSSDFSSYVTALDVNHDNTNDYYMVPNTTGKKGCIVNRVFGCNNLNGTPKGNATVHVYGTQNKDASKTTIGAKFNRADYSAYTISNYSGLVTLAEGLSINVDTDKATLGSESASEDAKKTALSNIVTAVEDVVSNKRYDVKAVYGGGNEATYNPTTAYNSTTATGSKSQVIIEGCDYTSIETVYGGGNAAPVPEANVTIHSDYEIETVFGGGNGKDAKESDGSPNEGADVGTLDHGNNRYGTGNANTLITGGYIHELYGGSNELGIIMGSAKPNATADGICSMIIGKFVGAGKNADIMGDNIVTLGCMPDSWVNEIYGGADNANVHGNVELTITSGKFRKVFGGNNENGIIMGHIKVNIEETGCRPIEIDELYLGGNQAPYSYYGYYVKTKKDDQNNIVPDLTDSGMLQFEPRESENDEHKAVKKMFHGPGDYEEYSGTGEDIFSHYDKHPELNIISCTRIGKVFGGGLGEPAAMYANPTVNINMIPGSYSSSITREGVAATHRLGAIGDVYGGGDAAAVYGNTTVNIGTANSVSLVSTGNTGTVEGAYITNNVYGGGKLADVTGNTYVNVCAEQVAVLDANSQPTGEYTYNIVNITGTDYEGVTIGGNVYGGGEGYAKMEPGTDGEAFLCAKAMIGVDGEGIEDKNGDGKADHPEGGTSVVIGNGTVNGNVYGGGKVGRVEKNTKVTIGIGAGTGNSSATSKPVIMGNVFGAGAGVNTHGYSALVRGTSTVLVEGDAKVKGSVYGGGEIASVGRYKVVGGLPQVLNNALAPTSGYCYVTIRGYAEIGPDNMEMTKLGGPSDAGHVFGAGQGVLPYDDAAGAEPFHMNGQQVLNNGTWDGKSWSDKAINYPAYDATQPLDDNYAKFIKSLALATETLVTIEGNPFIKGSVYGGSENGYVQKDSRVVISGGQIGNGYVQMDDDGNYLATKYSVNRRYSDEEWAAGHLIKDGETNYAHSLPECASWPYGETITVPSGENTTTTKTIYAPYDKYAMITVGHEEEYEMAYDVAGNTSTNGGRRQGSDGHTFYGNVFGGGSGYYPYKPGRWFEDAGAVYGNTYVTIKGGHILTSVYGGNEMTDVGKYADDDQLNLTSGGSCYVTMIGGTLGVPRTLKQIEKHPVTCYLFGAGKGDQRVFFNKSTNVGNVYVHISDDARIYGSVFGGGEDGHVMKNVEMNIGGNTLPAVYSSSSTDEVLKALNLTAQGTKPVETSEGTITHPYIGNWGTSYVDGNVFGAGRGFGGDAYTAGNVAGTVTMNIYGGTMLGSIYGGGRLGSVGYGLFDEGVAGYGEMQDDYKREKYDGTLENNVSGFKRGYVYMTIGKDDGTGPTIGNTWEYVNVPTEITESGLAAWKTTNHVPNTEYETTTETITNEGNSTTLYHHRLKHTKGGNVFAGGMGRLTQLDGSTPITAVDWWKLGCVKSTTLTIKGGNIKSNVYGGGELGQVVKHHTTNNVNLGTEITIQGSNTAVPTIGTEIKDGDKTLYTFGSVFGGGYGSLMEKAIKGKSPKYIAGLVKEDTKIVMQDGKVKACIYGGGEMASVGESTTTEGTTTATGSTYVSVSGGTVGIEPITVDGKMRYFGGAKMGNVYGGGSGHNNTVRSGKIFNNTNVTISDGTIYHNVYGGGAYGTVGDFTYSEKNETITENGEQINVKKVNGVSGLAAIGTGVATVTITGGTIGYDGKENGMVFGSSRGDINGPGKRDDHTAWVYDTHVTIGTSGSQTGPQINGTVYGSGENGHVFNDTEVTVYSGTIGITDGRAITYTENGQSVTKGGAAYPYRGNVYGGGCGTDKYYSDLTGVDDPHDGNGDKFNPLAGIVYGTTTVNINGGTVVRNVYGAGAMGSVGKATTTEGVTTITGGTTSINVSGGTIGIDGTKGDGNVFGAARGDSNTTQTGLAFVKETGVTISGTAQIMGNVYGGGEIGCVGSFNEDTRIGKYIWSSGGLSTVTVNGGTIGTDSNDETGHVFGAGKGMANNFKCDKAMVKETEVSVGGGTVYGNVYGGGEIGRVEEDTKVIVGRKPNETEGAGTGKPIINGSVFGAGRGVATHGYSALVRGNTEVTVEGDTGAKISGSVFGGGEIASVGRYGLNTDNMPDILLGGGTCEVNVLGNIEIAGNVFGAGEGVDPQSFNKTGSDKTKLSRRMTVYTNDIDFPDEKGTPTPTPTGSTWEYYDKSVTPKLVWEYFQSEDKYAEYLQTLALATAPHVTIGGSTGNTTVKGSVFGGGKLGLTKGSVTVTINNGTIGTLDNEGKVVNGTGDVYGGGSLANTNTTHHVGKKNADESPIYKDPDTKKIIDTKEVHPTTIVRLKGGRIYGDAYGGGLGRLSSTGVNAVEAEVVGNVLVDLNGETTVTTDVDGGRTWTANTGTAISGKGCIVNRIFGCNNLNGTPKSGVTVHVYATQRSGKNTINDNVAASKTNGEWDLTTFDVSAVYGGGNLATYYPTNSAREKSDEVKDQAYTTVIIDGCDLTSIGQVYGGGNAASAPATNVIINGSYEIGEAFGGGNGKDRIKVNDEWQDNPGANVGYFAYPDAAGHAYATKQDRETYYAYGSGKAHITIYGGTVHKVFGGSNTKGNVRVESRTTLEDLGCHFTVGESYGGGNNAPQDGDAVLEIGCISGLGTAYGGASNADINGDVKLNITNGTYGRVFGGNDQGGAIRGSITVNIEETGCNPIIIGELYGGGNQAGYSIYGYDASGNVLLSGSNPVNDPKVNVKSFTSIGTVYGGGYGASATMVGNPEVNINVFKGKYAETYNGSDNVIGDNARIVGSAVTSNASSEGYGSGYPIPSHKAGDIGAIGSVFGGGNAAEVIGTPHVNIGTKVGEVIPLVSKPIEDSEGRAPSPNANDWTPSYQLVTVEGVDIRGNVYGGGNEAEVTGNTDVVIGKNDDVKTYSFTSYSAETGGNVWSSGLAQTTGNYVTLNDNSKLAEVEILTNGKYGEEYVGKKFYVNPKGSGRLQLYDANKQATSIWVSIEPFEYKTYTFTSYGAASGGTEYSTGTAAPTGNFKTFNDTDYMQIVVLTNPNYVSWEGKTFYVPVNAKTDGTERTQLRKATGDPEAVWVLISEANN